MEKRKAEEVKFHDAIRQANLDVRTQQRIKQFDKWYSIARKSNEKVLECIRDYSDGSVILDYCCGNGNIAIRVAEFDNCEVIGIDISKVSIENATNSATEKGLSRVTKFYVMDAEKMSFSDSSFDIIYCSGVLHHLDLDSAYCEMARVLRPNGRVIMNEPLIYNPLIHFYRKRTPQLRTEWEVNHILRKRDIELAKKYFDDVNIVGFFHLFAIAAVPFRDNRNFKKILRVLDFIDFMILRLPVIKWLAWQVVYVAVNPKCSE